MEIRKYYHQMENMRKEDLEGVMVKFISPAKIMLAQKQRKIGIQVIQSFHNSFNTVL